MKSIQCMLLRALNQGSSAARFILFFSALCVAGIQSVDAAQVQHLGTQSAIATGAGATGLPTIASFTIPSGKNRALFIWPSFERDHCSNADVTGTLCASANAAGTGLGDNYPEPRIGTPPATTSNNQLTARVVGPGGTINKQNALVVGGTPSGDTRFINISTSPTGSPAGTAFFSVSSFHIVLFENEINTLLGGAASGTVSITLPDVVAATNAGDDALLIASVYQNVEQTVTGFVRNATATAQVVAGTPGNSSLAPAAYDATQVPDEADDGKLVTGANASTEGFVLPAGHVALATLSVTNAGGNYDTPNGNVHNEPNGFTGGAYFRNGGATPATLYTLQMAGAAATLTYGATNASFLLESDNADVADAPISYGNPTHTIAGIRLGSSADADAALLNSASADGDDLNNTDDENGLTLTSPLALGGTASVPVVIQNGSGFLDAWFDWNSDGDFNDAGEQMTSSQAVAIGTVTLSIAVPVSAVAGQTFARFRVCTNNTALDSCATPAGTVQSGEVEDYAVTLAAIDFGDLPDTTAGTSAANYETLTANGGPSHVISAGLFLGAGVDSDGNGQPNLAATGDDVNGSAPDDETGFISLTNSNPTSPCLGTSTLRFTATAPIGVDNARLNVFVDRNGDGDFGDPAEVGSITFSGTASTQNVDVVLPARTFPQCAAAALVTGGVVGIRARLALASDMIAATTANAATEQAGLRNSGEVEDYNTSTSGTVPVTLSHVQISSLGSDLLINFHAASEAGTLGYRVLADLGRNEQARIELGTLASQAIDSLTEQTYSLRVRNPGSQQLWIEEFAVDGAATLYGPYQVGQSIGERKLAPAMNWSAVNAEQSAFRSAQNATLRVGNSGVAELSIRQSGWVSLSAQQLRDAGVDTAGELRVERAGKVVPIALLRTGNALATVSFYADAISDSLYTSTAVYRIMPGTGARLAVQDGVVDQTGLTAVPSERQFNNNRLYSFSAPVDPWFDFRALRNGASNGGSTTFTLSDHVAPQGYAESIELRYWGGLNYNGDSDDHHVVFSLNGTPIGEDRFDGFAARSLRLELPANVLRSGVNTLSLSLPADTGFAADIVNVEGYTISYARSLAAQDSALHLPIKAITADTLYSSGFEDGARQLTGTGTGIYTISNLTVPVVVLLERAGVRTLIGTSRASSVNVQLDARIDDHLIVQPAATSSTLRASPQVADPISAASYLIISHPSFIGGLSQFVAAKQAQGFSVSVVDVEALYRYYTGGVVDPAAIQAAIREAESLGTTHVLLVGGDSYDYQNHLGINSVSFIPTHYRRINPIIGFAPADAVYADTNGDGRPNVALGRWPVRSSSELANVIAKTLSYQGTNKALFVSDRSLNGVSYRADIESLQSLLSPAWQTSSVSLDSYDPSATALARADALSALSNRTSLLSYYGHSAPASWSREGLVTASQVAGGLFGDVSQSFATLQLGCWGTYFVEPTATTVAHQMLLMPKGAVLVLGASSLTESANDLALARGLLPNIGTLSVGQALRQTQATIATEQPEALDVILGGTLLGDPALKITQER